MNSTQPVQRNHPSLDDLNKSIVMALKARSFIDCARRAAEHIAQESGQDQSVVPVLEDCLILIDDIRQELEEVESTLRYGTPTQLQPLSE